MGTSTARAGARTTTGLGRRATALVGSSTALFFSALSFVMIISSGGWSKDGQGATACSDLQDTAATADQTTCSLGFFPLGIEVRGRSDQYYTATNPGELYAASTSWGLTLALVIPLALLVTATVLAWRGVAPERAQRWALGRSRFARTSLLACATVVVGVLAAVAGAAAVLVVVFIPLLLAR